MALRRFVAGVLAVLAATIGLLAWLTTPGYTAGARVPGMVRQTAPDALLLTGPEGWNRRRELLRRATFDYADEPQQWPPLDSCTFLPGEPGGTTPKFDCLFPGGEVLRVKYGRGPEPHAEVASTLLLKALGYGADHVVFTPALRCYGCPRYPFAAMKAAARLRTFGLPSPSPPQSGYTDFTWVSIERKLQLRPVETEHTEGWAWWELRRSDAPRADVDAFRLLAVFLGHWDNKAVNQRLVCRDEACHETLAIMHDVGATFGPSKVNLAAWRREPIWANRARCVISMSRLPFSGATFEDATITDAGRRLLLSRLRRLSDDDLRAIFTAARFPEFQSATDDGRDIDAWIDAFRHRVSQIASTRCPD